MNASKQRELLKLLEENSRYDYETLAAMLNVSINEIKESITTLEQERIIVKYPTLVNWEKFSENDRVTALIEVKVTPKRDVGFDHVAKRIYRFPEVTSVYLVSGAFDLCVIVEGKTVKEVASFVSQKLATIDSVNATATHFLLKKYKHDGIVLDEADDDQRMVMAP
ncbi:Lrp/AsnC family transcriptional regulator [Numidum massiliense]|uniref:Lrp/AsnC family transcriptional regulator n=1 Tax=Numidum massiliense TaxID=1522315 RepID=UPI0006D58CDF|nr:Lrp/AsnC family transcriptional regulator [Numidum massiliense]